MAVEQVEQVKKGEQVPHPSSSPDECSSASLEACCSVCSLSAGQLSKRQQGMTVMTMTTIDIMIVAVRIEQK